jgi:hypothetical protein
MPRLACIVEGQGDVLSIPAIIRRIAYSREVFDVHVVRPLRVHRTQIVRAGELERAVDLAARSLGGPGGILIVLDADDDAPCQLGPTLAVRAAAARMDVPSGVVIANKEKEAWYIAAVESLRGHRGIPENAVRPANPESIRGAKEWLGERMGQSYSTAGDEPAFANLFDLAEARAASPSFDKCCREVTRLLGIPPA